MCDIPQTLCGKIALISGSSAGIGAAIAHELSARGASIVLNYPTSAEAAACQAVGATLVTPWTAVCADLSTLDGPAALVAAAVARFGHTIHILVNNAAVVPHASTFLLTQAVLPHLPSMPPSTGLDSIPLVDQAGIPGGGRIICIGSGSGRVPQLGLLTYAATKGALASMIKVMARELPPVYGCTVNGVALVSWLALRPPHPVVELLLRQRTLPGPSPG